MILVTGATGKVGGQAARILADRGISVRAFVRSAEKAVSLGAVGAEIAVGTFDDPASIEDALVGVETVVLVSPGDPGHETAVVDAAVRAGVCHVVYATSKASLDASKARRRWHAQVEEALDQSGIAHTLLRSNAYMQNTLAFGPSIVASGSFASSTGDGRIGMVDTRDVALVAASIAGDPQPHGGRTYLLTGPAAISYPEVAQTLTELLGRVVKFESISPEEDRSRMIQRGIPEAVATMNAQAFALIAEGDADWVTDDIAAITGQRARDFRAFAIDHLRAFEG